MQDYGAYGYGPWTATQNFTLDITYTVSLGDPSGTLTSWDDTFHWIGLQGATCYWLQVQDSGGTILRSKWVQVSVACDAGFACNYTLADLTNT